MRQQCAAKALARAGRSAEFPRLQKPLAHRETASNLLASSLNPHLSSMTVESGSSVEVVKSPQDARLYRYLELENGLRVLLISDPEMAGAEEDDEDDDDDYSEGSESDSDEPADDLDDGKRCRPEKPDKFGDTVRKRFSGMRTCSRQQVLNCELRAYFWCRMPVTVLSERSRPNQPRRFVSNFSTGQGQGAYSCWTWLKAQALAYQTTLRCVSICRQLQHWLLGQEDSAIQISCR